MADYMNIETMGSIYCKTCSSQTSDPSGFIWTLSSTAQQCTALEPCLHGGTCTQKIGTYECACVDGYEGMNCETGVKKINIDNDIL